jgi:hypothetical protein
LSGGRPPLDLRRSTLSPRERAQRFSSLVPQRRTNGQTYNGRGVTTRSKIIFSLSCLFFLYARSGFLLFFNLYDKSRPENQTKRGEIDLFRTISKVLAYVLESFSLRCLFEKNRFPGDPQKHFGNSARYPLSKDPWNEEEFVLGAPEALPLWLSREQPLTNTA